MTLATFKSFRALNLLLSVLQTPSSQTCGTRGRILLDWDHFVSKMIYVCAYVICGVVLLDLHAHVCAAAVDLDYPTPDQFGNLVLPDVQVVNSGEFQVQVRLPGLGTNGQALNAMSPSTVNVDVQGQWWCAYCVQLSQCGNL